MGWPSKLTYAQVSATGIGRSLVVLAHYGDLAGISDALGADPAMPDRPEAVEALAEAAENGHEAIVRLILRYRPRLIERVAVCARTRELTEFLFQSGMNPNLTSWLGMTPLHRFAGQGDVEKAAIFLDHGANLHTRDEEYCTTPLGYAAAAGKLLMVEFLLRRGAKPSLPDDRSWATPIALAAYENQEDVVRVLKTFVETGALPTYRRETFESVANDIVTACQSGDSDSFQRVIGHFHIRRPMAWDRPGVHVRISRLRRFIWNRLGIHTGQQEDHVPDLSHARLLVARSYGFETWDQLATQWSAENSKAGDAPSL